MASRCGHWVCSLGGALNDVISGPCVLTSLFCFHTFFSTTSQSIIIPTSHFIFSKNVFVSYNIITYIYLYTCIIIIYKII